MAISLTFESLFETAWRSCGAPCATPKRSIINGVIAFVTVVLVVTGWAARTNRAAEFYVAAGQLTPAVNALASQAGWLALPAFAALAGLMYSYGFDALAFVIGPVAGLP